jgi:endoglucanase
VAMTTYTRRDFIAASAALVAVSRALPLQAQHGPDSVAFARAEHLQRGINASQWFSSWSRDYSVQRLETYTTAADIALIAKVGFDHVRLPIDPDPLVQWQSQSQWGRTPFVTELDRAVKLILDNHLSVIIDIHPQDSYKMALRQGVANVTTFNELWRALAAHFASTDPEHVFFEIMNEPFQEDTYRWQGIQSLVAQTIRSQAPQHTIIAAGDHLSSVEDLLAIGPIDVENAIYTFHHYQPYPFTQQGAVWRSEFLQPLRRIPYPSSPDAIAPKLDEEPTLAGRMFLAQYGLDRWDATRLEAIIGYAAQWSRLWRVPVYCGEFGAMRAYAEPSTRAQYLHDMRMALVRNSIGWAMWDYQDSFGLVTKANGVPTPNAGVLEALGLYEPA